MRSVSGWFQSCTRPLNQYHVVMEVAPQYWQNPATLHDIYVRSPSGAQVPLSAVARYRTHLDITRGQSSGTVSSGHAVVQYGDGNVAGSGGGGD